MAFSKVRQQRRSLGPEASKSQLTEWSEVRVSAVKRKNLEKLVFIAQSQD